MSYQPALMCGLCSLHQPVQRFEKLLFHFLVVTFQHVRSGSSHTRQRVRFGQSLMSFSSFPDVLAHGELELGCDSLHYGRVLGSQQLSGEFADTLSRRHVDYYVGLLRRLHTGKTLGENYRKLTTHPFYFSKLHARQHRSDFTS